jgi:hypothetical protein
VLGARNLINRTRTGKFTLPILWLPRDWSPDRVTDAILARARRAIGVDASADADRTAVSAKLGIEDSTDVEEPASAQKASVYRHNPSPEREASKPGDTIGSYRIVRTLGGGATGITYEAKSTKDGARVALKELRPSRSDDEDLLDRLEEQARVLATITHPALPAYIDHFSLARADGPHFYLVQRFARGTSLAQRAAGGFRADEAEAKRIAVTLLEVIDRMHAQKPPVLHLDIKPENVILGDEGEIWLVDFGSVDNPPSREASERGDDSYQAPDQLGGVAGPRTHLYALAATLLFAMSGRSPAEMSQSNRRIDFRSSVRASPSFELWLERMLEPAPEDRPSSARRAMDDMQKLDALSKRWSFGRGKGVAIVAALAVLLCVASVAALLGEKKGAVTGAKPMSPPVQTDAREPPAGPCDGVSLLGNCNFEVPSIRGCRDFSVGAINLSGWEVVSEPGQVLPPGVSFPLGNVSLCTTHNWITAKDGPQALDLTGATQTNTGVAQIVPTKRGKRYRLGFWVGNVVDPRGPYGIISTVKVRINHELVFSATNSEGAGVGTRSVTWKPFTYSFVATAEQTEIAFFNGDPPNDSVNMIDNVFLTVDANAE